MTIDQVVLVDEKASQDKDGNHYSQVWHIHFHSGFSAAAILIAPPAGLPKRGQNHPVDVNCYCDTIDIELHEGDIDCPVDASGNNPPTIAVVKIEFPPKPAWGFDPIPVNRPPVIEWEGSDLTEVPYIDVNGDPIVNSAGELYTGLPERPIRKCASLTITRIETANPATNIITYSNTTNSATWNGVAIGKGLMGRIRAQQGSEVVNGTLHTFWTVTYPIVINDNGWKLKPIDAGWSYLNDDGHRVDAIDDNGTKPSLPILLDGSGGKLTTAPTTAVVYPTAGYKVLDEAAWGSLSLPNPFA